MTTAWEKVFFEEYKFLKGFSFNRGSIFYAIGDETEEFLKEAGGKARAYIKNKNALLLYNTETGDIHIPGSRTPEEIAKIKGEFLYFISRDTHEELYKDIPWKEVN